MHGRKATGWWQLAAYGSSSGLEESTQDGDLEERVERHVAVICARAGGHCGVTRRDGGLTVRLRARRRGASMRYHTEMRKAKSRVESRKSLKRTLSPRCSVF